MSGARSEALADGVVCYLGDCRDVLPTLPPSDIVVTDPPYKSLDIDVIRGTTTRLVDGRNTRAGDRIGSGAWFSTLSDPDLTALLLEMYGRLPDTASLYVFSDVKTGLRVLPALPAANVIVWDKMSIGMGYSWRLMHEWIAYCPKPNHKLRSMAFGDIIRAPTVENKVHPTEKPAQVIKQLLLNSSDPGAMVLDPFMGAGSTGVAAVQLGRHFTGIEIEQKYFDIACRRIDAALREPDLFLERPARAEQAELQFQTQHLNIGGG